MQNFDHLKDKLRQDSLVRHLLDARREQHKKQQEANDRPTGLPNFRPLQYLKNLKPSVKIGCTAALTVLIIWICTTFSFGYIVCVDDTPLFSVTGLGYVNKSISDIENDVHNSLGTKVPLANRVTFRRVIVKKSDTTGYPAMKDALQAAFDKNVTASAIVINGEPAVYVPDEDTANRIIDRVKEDGTVVESGETLVSVAIQEEISIQECIVNISDMMSVDDAVHYLKTGDQTPITYTLKTGDTLWTIARVYHMSVDAIAQLNNIDKNQILVAGDTITLTQDHPLISVVATVTHEDIETIPFEVITEEDPNSTAVVVKQEGVDGERTVDYTDSRTNGITTSQQITKETVTKEKQDRIIVRGTKVVIPNLNFGTGVPITGNGMLNWPTQGTITQYFGDNDGHTGLDIANELGTPVYAAASGSVIYTHESNVSYGNYIVLQHSDTLITRYCHLNEILVNSGDYVSAGQLIGYMGSTGNSTGPHLHFEVLVDGNFVNPLAYLSN